MGPLAWLIPSIISAGGQLLTNQSAKKQADKQMNFQERMSSTAAQRSVADYKAAGLNPGLAYERSASTPGGASAIIGNVAEAGVNSAQSARRTAADLATAKAQQNLLGAQEYATKAAGARDTTQALVNAEQKALLQQQFRFNAKLQPQTLSQASSQALSLQYLLPGLRNTADLEKRLGELSPGLSSAKIVAEIIKLIGGNR